ncbi:eukaryotic aspartyl protease domain-containing protein [Ditylenchus destructor]|uniref:Eukaryotic aspartyl protease domain-containing protein n=1 Tax=Ditylenchus destructor TaxID=166010 RepID=A0AAD4MP63_9BILA|nr:eukaryotic aspartyl protease domain-containing protein [Ditylenchus destructor]
MPIFVFLVFCLSALMAVPVCECDNGLKIPVKIHRLSPDVLSLQRESIQAKAEMYSKKSQGLPINPKFKQSASSSINLNATDIWVYIANITVGTPGQVLTVIVDPWRDQELCILGTANIFDSDIQQRNFYDSSKSNTSEIVVGLQGKFVTEKCGRGKIGVDLVNIGKSSMKMAFGVIEEAAHFPKGHKIDGIIGINPFSGVVGDPRRNIPQSAISQLLSQLDYPIMTWWQNKTDYENSYKEMTAQLTLGVEDTEHCEAPYVYVPNEEERMESYGGTYPVHVTSADLEGDSSGRKEMKFELNGTLQFWHMESTIYTPPSFFYALTNATNAEYKSSVNKYVVDCDLSKHRNITLNVGGSGHTEDATSRKIVLTPPEFGVSYETRDNVCYLEVIIGSEDCQTIELGQSFLNKHCLAYNAKDGTVGFSDVKPKSSEDYEYSAEI